MRIARTSRPISITATATIFITYRLADRRKVYARGVPVVIVAKDVGGLIKAIVAAVGGPQR
jgi:hypothetical protein